MFNRVWVIHVTRWKHMIWCDIEMIYFYNLKAEQTAWVWASLSPIFETSPTTFSQMQRGGLKLLDIRQHRGTCSASLARSASCNGARGDITIIVHASFSKAFANWLWLTECVPMICFWFFFEIRQSSPMLCHGMMVTAWASSQHWTTVANGINQNWEVTCFSEKKLKLIKSFRTLHILLIWLGALTTNRLCPQPVRPRRLEKNLLTVDHFTRTTAGNPDNRSNAIPVLLLGSCTDLNKSGNCGKFARMKSIFSTAYSQLNTQSHKLS